MRKLILAFLPAVLLLTIALDGRAQSGTGTPATSTTETFASLSPGNQKIAQALFDAQVKPAPGAATSSTAPKAFTRDQIAAMKQSGQGWGKVFKTVKAEGQLPGAKNLGQVVSSKHPLSTGTTITTASGRTEVVGPGGSVGLASVAGPDAAAHGVGRSADRGKGGSSPGGQGHATHGKPNQAVAHGKPK